MEIVIEFTDGIITTTILSDDAPSTIQEWCAYNGYNPENIFNWYEL